VVDDEAIEMTILQLAAPEAVNEVIAVGSQGRDKGRNTRERRMGKNNARLLALGLICAGALSTMGAKSAEAQEDTPNGAQTNGVTLPGAKLEKLAGDLAFTEGPTSDAAGNVFFTDQPNDRILKWGLDDKLSTFLHPAGRSNGMSFDPAGDLWACADENNQLWRIEPNGTKHVEVLNFEGKLLNGPNDLWIRPDGGLYITDPFYKRDYWKRGPKEQENEGVFYLAPGPSGGRKLTRVLSDLKQSNGIIGTLDGKTLYVADIGDSKTYSYDIQPDGSLTNKKLFCNLGSDGMTIDTEGNLYLTGKGVTVFDKTGRQIEHITVDEPWTANVCFGGAQKQWLYITASKSLYRIATRTRGADGQ
jgi:gluconolactonase